MSFFAFLSIYRIIQVGWSQSIGSGAIPTRLCNTCQQHSQPPPPCSTCGSAPPPPCTTCYQPPPPPACSWTLWTAWSECSVTCGSGGVRYRTHECTCAQCSGPASEQQLCNGPYQCPTTCNTCNNPPPPPSCSTCNQPAPPPPSCSTCGGIGTGAGISMGNNAYYDPYRNGKRRRRSSKNLSETLKIDS